MKQEDLRIGIVGMGKMGSNHLRVLYAIPGVTVTDAVDLDLAVKVIRTAIDYAADLGFDPHPDFAEVEPLLAGAQPALCSVPVPVGGDDGKPFFVAGPHDDAESIMAILSRRLGREGFHYLVPVAGDVPFDEFDDDVVDDVEPEEVSPLSIDDEVRLVEPVSVASASQWLSRWFRRSAAR